MAQKYKFRREDNGKIVHVDWETMMTKDRLGYLTLPDGTIAKQVHDSHRMKLRGSQAELVKGKPRGESFAAGFVGSQYDVMEEHRQKHGFTGVEFVEDREVKGFYNAKFNCSDAERDRYLQHRGIFDANSHNGAGHIVTPDDIEAARKRVSA